MIVEQQHAQTMSERSSIRVDDGRGLFDVAVEQFVDRIDSVDEYIIKESRLKGGDPQSSQSFIDRASLSEKGAPLQKERWAGAVDAVGGITLVNVLAQTKYGRGVAACGLASSADLPATVLPHILRSVALLGVDSVNAPIAKREKAWQRLARDLSPKKLAEMTRVEPMSNLVELAGSILAGQVRGRVVIDVKR